MTTPYRPLAWAPRGGSVSSGRPFENLTPYRPMAWAPQGGAVPSGRPFGD